MFAVMDMKTYINGDCRKIFHSSNNLKLGTHPIRRTDQGVIRKKSTAVVMKTRRRSLLK